MANGHVEPLGDVPGDRTGLECSRHASVTTRDGMLTIVLHSDSDFSSEVRDVAQITSIKVIDKSLRILSLFTGNVPEWSLAELTAETGLAKSTIYRIVSVLAAHKYLEQHGETRRFRLGLRALELGWHAHVGMEWPRLAMPILNHLAAESRQTVCLQVLSHDRSHIVCVARVPRDSGLHLILDVGSTAPLYAGSSSKILMAFLPSHDIDAIIARGLEPLTQHTITDPDKLRSNLAASRRAGYSVSLQETDIGAAGVSVPVLDAHNRVVAGLTIAEPISKVDRMGMARLLELAQQGARAISREVESAEWPLVPN